LKAILILKVRPQEEIRTDTIQQGRLKQNERVYGRGGEEWQAIIVRPAGHGALNLKNLNEIFADLIFIRILTMSYLILKEKPRIIKWANWRVLLTIQSNVFLKL